MVSSFGRVISLGRKIVNNLGVRITDPFIKKNNNITNSGYIQIRLWKNNKCNHLYAHRLVATAFIPNPNNYPCIDHIDTIKTNNHYLNLRWCTNSMNHLNPITRKRNSLSKIGARGIIENKSKPVVRIDPQNPNCIKIYESPMFAKTNSRYITKVIYLLFVLAKGIIIKDTYGFIYPITNHIPVFQRSNYLIIKILQTIF